jgi:hypothetical protein
MFQSERQSPPAAAFPPSAAEPAAGIASAPHEDLPMPAASFFDVSTEESSVHAIRQHAIEPKQCRWILADEDLGAEALMCGAPAVRHRSFCADHCARVYMPRMEDEAEEGAEAEAAPERERKLEATE